MSALRDFRHVSEFSTRGMVSHAPDVSPISFCQIKVHALTTDDLNQAVQTAIYTDDKQLFANHNSHSVALLNRVIRQEPDCTLARFYKRSTWTVVDGMSIVLLARLNGFTLEREHRIALNVWLPELLDTAQMEGWRVFYLGSTQMVIEEGSRRLHEKYPALKLETRSGFFSKARDSAQNQAVLAKIRAFRPQILFVGMGMPTQEEWIEENFDAIDANVIIPSGALMDYFADALPTPPEWVGRIGLEWLYRLVNEPGRLGHRYLVEPWQAAVDIYNNRAL